MHLQATPLTSGAAALIWSAKPSASYAEIRWEGRWPGCLAVAACRCLCTCKRAPATRCPAWPIYHSSNTTHPMPPRRSALLSSVDQVPALADKVTSKGRLNVARALAALLGRPAPWFPAPACETLLLPCLCCPLLPWLGWWLVGQAHAVHPRSAHACCLPGPTPPANLARQPSLPPPPHRRPSAVLPVVQPGILYSFQYPSEYFARKKTYTAASLQACQDG